MPSPIYALPKQVLIREDGPREGFQMQQQSYPTASKVELIDRLSQTGVSSIEITSFVRPDRVPQLADAEAVIEAFTPKAGVRYRALYLNQKGLLRALASPKLAPEGYVLIAASEEFLKRNNNQTLTEAIDQLASWISTFKAHQLPFERVMLSTAFGDSYSGRIETHLVLGLAKRIINRCQEFGLVPAEFTFADTTGYGNPESVKRLVGGFSEVWPEIAVGLHLHDTRGTGMANVYAGLEMGVARFDCSVGGLGGCPFAVGAAGNVPTEDVAFMCAELGIATGIDLKKYLEVAQFAEQLIGRPLPGKLKQAGLL